jgi:hypothetical protein
MPVRQYSVLMPQTFPVFPGPTAVPCRASVVSPLERPLERPNSSSPENKRSSEHRPRGHETGMDGGPPRPAAGRRIATHTQQHWSICHRHAKSPQSLPPFTRHKALPSQGISLAPRSLEDQRPSPNRFRASPPAGGSRSCARPSSQAFTDSRAQLAAARLRRWAFLSLLPCNLGLPLVAPVCFANDFTRSLARLYPRPAPGPRDTRSA